MACPQRVSLPVRQVGMTPIKRQKYRAARAFYLVLLVLSLLTAWTLIADRTGRSRSSGEQSIVRRAEVDTIHDTKKGVPRDEEVMRSQQFVNDVLPVRQHR